IRHHHRPAPPRPLLGLDHQRPGADPALDRARTGLSGLGRSGSGAGAASRKPRGMRRFDAILFDCDGVLIDSEPLGCAALARAVTEAGMPMTQEQATALFSGSAAAESRARMARLGLDAATVFAESDRILF